MHALHHHAQLIYQLDDHLENRRHQSRVLSLLYSSKLYVHSAIVETFLPAPLKPNFLIVLCSQPTVGPSSILLLVSIKKGAVSGRGINLFASRSAASSS